ncbi:MAG: hypothetical protein Q9N32_02320 [Gammaproteobacteria bacterium]|nr:hypothetical protein [Gammaproteobacteria bacterium]
MSFAESLMNKLTFPKKMALIAGVFLFPIIIASTLLLQELTVKINITEHEKQGIQYINTVRQVYQHLPEHRGMTNAYLNGNTSYKPKILIKEREITADIAAINDITRQLGEEFETHLLWQQIQQDWQTLEKILLANLQNKYSKNILS